MFAAIGSLISILAAWKRSERQDSGGGGTNRGELIEAILDEVEKLLDSAVGTDENSFNQSEYLVSAEHVDRLDALMGDLSAES